MDWSKRNDQSERVLQIGLGDSKRQDGGKKAAFMTVVRKILIKQRRSSLKWLTYPFI